MRIYQPQNQNGENLLTEATIAPLQTKVDKHEGDITTLQNTVITTVNLNPSKSNGIEITKSQSGNSLTLGVDATGASYNPTSHTFGTGFAFGPNVESAIKAVYSSASVESEGGNGVVLSLNNANSQLKFNLSVTPATLDGTVFTGGPAFALGNDVNTVFNNILPNYQKRVEKGEYSVNSSAPDHKIVDGKLTVTSNIFETDIDIVSIIDNTGTPWMGQIETGMGSAKVVTLWAADDAPEDAEELSFTVTYIGY